MTKKEFTEHVKDCGKQLQQSQPGLRFGQAVFLVTEKQYREIVRQCIIDRHSDCFYTDNNIDEFLSYIYDNLPKDNEHQYLPYKYIVNM